MKLQSSTGREINYQKKKNTTNVLLDSASLLMLFSFGISFLSVNCPDKDMWYCGKAFQPEHCIKFGDLKYNCPYMCGVCQGNHQSREIPTVYTLVLMINVIKSSPPYYVQCKCNNRSFKHKRTVRLRYYMTKFFGSSPVQDGRGKDCSNPRIVVGCFLVFSHHDAGARHNIPIEYRYISQNNVHGKLLIFVFLFYDK